MIPKGGTAVPEFPTGNGQIDLILRHAGQEYGIEVKSFSNQYEYRKALIQTVRYAKKMGWSTVWLVFFTEQIDDKHRKRYEAFYRDDEAGVEVVPIFIETGA